MVEILIICWAVGILAYCGAQYLQYRENAITEVRLILHGTIYFEKLPSEMQMMYGWKYRKLWTADDWRKFLDK